MSIELIKPLELIQKFALNAKHAQFIYQARKETINIIQKKNRRLLVITGPCSIHDLDATLEYASLLKKAQEQFSDELYIIMRCYFQKPRTSLGWKGLINDPHLNESYDVNHGIMLARKILLKLSELCIPTATEFVDPLMQYYFGDLITWSAIGARTVESQTHRELASGLNMPVGFKNNTSGDIKVAIDAMKVAKESHHCFGLNVDGSLKVAITPGNPHTHIILRGSYQESNYSASHIHDAIQKLHNENLTPHVLIDCSHGNSLKDFHFQSKAVEDVMMQFQQNPQNILGIMLESFLVAGKQPLTSHQPLTYGQSITDGCLSWQDSLKLLEKLARTVHKYAKVESY